MPASIIGTPTLSAESNSNPHTLSVTVPSGCARAVFFIVSGNGGSVTGVELDGNPCTSRLLSAGVYSLAAYDITNPAAGTVNVVVDFTGAINSQIIPVFIADVVTGAPESSASAETFNTARLLDPTTVDGMVVYCAMRLADTDATAGGGLTEYVDGFNGTLGVRIFMGALVADAATETPTYGDWTGDSFEPSSLALAYAPSAPPPATPGHLANFTAGGSPFTLNQSPSTGNLMVITDA